jgi:hypothetical protein
VVVCLFVCLFVVCLFVVEWPAHGVYVINTCDNLTFNWSAIPILYSSGRIHGSACNVCPGSWPHGIYEQTAALKMVHPSS